MELIYSWCLGRPPRLQSRPVTQWLLWQLYLCPHLMSLPTTH